MHGQDRPDLSRLTQFGHRKQKASRNESDSARGCAGETLEPGVARVSHRATVERATSPALIHLAGQPTLHLGEVAIAAC
jgi:hypothetical protein